jgi:ADP-ribose pyrophosphatase
MTTHQSKLTSENPHLFWKTIKEEPAQNYRIFDAKKVLREHPITKAQRYYSVIDTLDSVSVLAITSDQEVVFVKQYRHGIDAISLEIPGGIIDPGEDAQVAVQRELLEETGYRSQNWQKLGKVAQNPAIQNNRCEVWLALDAQKTDHHDWDEGEVMETVLLPFKDCQAMILDGTIEHSVVINAFYFYALRNAK